MIELLKNLTLDYWYKMLIAACLGFLVLALTVPLYGGSNAAVALISLGGFLVGLGEWINHPYREKINLEYEIKIGGHVRTPCFGGVATEVVGAALVAWGLWKLIAFLS